MKSIKYVIFMILIWVFSISMVNALECQYKMRTYSDVLLKLTCSINGNNVSCSTNFDANIKKNSLNSNDYLDGNSYNCDKVKNVYADYYLNGTSYTINDLKKVNSCNNSCLTFDLINPSSEELQDESNGTESNGNFDTSAFCSRPEVKGAFRALGWVIFFVKIIVPIIIIVMGSIDVFKAVTSNKSDEISKSVKTLVIRVIAGIIIFFIPTFINFIVKFVSGGEEIYSEEHGTFLDCTHCMLNPTDDTCGSLMGGNQ